MTEQRRFYLMSNALVNFSDFEFENRKSLYETVGPEVRRQYRVEGYGHPFSFGLPNFTQTPKIKVAVKNKPLDLYGRHPWFVSTRAKELLCSVDAQAFDFLRCETSSPPRRPIEDYWMMDVKRVIEEFDDNKAVFDRRDAVELTTGKSHYNPFIGPLYEIRLPDLPVDVHAFWLKIYRTHPIFDGGLVDALRAAKLRGFRFTPLQWPTNSESADSWKDVTFPYWSNKVRNDA